MFVWVTSPDAAAYEFQLFQGGERVYRARVDEARLELPGRWRQAGRPHALLPGSYRWYVWTISKRPNLVDGVRITCRLGEGHNLRRDRWAACGNSSNDGGNDDRSAALSQ